jgi:hypothetical protein
MNRRWLKLSLCGILLSCTPGCLFVRQSTQVVREKEPIRSVQFESQQAKTLFEGGARQMQANKERSTPEVLAIPFLCLYAHSTELSDNAIYNDQAGICDANGDSFITFQEAAIYRAGVDEKVALAHKAKAGESGPKPDGVITMAQKPPDPPPALIHISSR